MENGKTVPKLNGIHKPHVELHNGSVVEETKVTSLAKLAHKWVIWEHWQNLGGRTVKGQTADDYKKDLKKVAEFDNLVTFWQLWHCLPHADPSNFLTIVEESTGKFFRTQYFPSQS